jgi:Galactose oxidase, central domain
MPNATFESLLTSQLREYAEAGVRPIDRFAIAEETIASGRASKGSRLSFRLGRRSLVLALAGFLILAMTASVALVGSRLLVPPPLPIRHTYLNELVSAPDLPTPMSSPALVTLADGRVLVVGGGGDVSHGTRALVYDPATGASVSAGPMLSADTLVVSAALRLLDGRVLVVGAADSQVFDPATMQFARVGPPGTAPRWGAAAALLPDGRVLVTGGSPLNGQGAPVNSADLFDPGTLTFSTTGSMAVARAGHSTVTLSDGRVFVTPGASRYAEVYDPSTGTFGPAGRTSEYVDGRAIAMPDGRVAILASSQLPGRLVVWRWDPTSRTFSKVSDLPEAITDATLLDDGRIFLIGLCHGRPTGWTGLFDPTTGVTIPTPGTRACRPTSTRLADGRVLIVGGLEPAFSTVEIFR